MQNCSMQFCSMCCQKYFYFVYIIEYLLLRCSYMQYWILYLTMWCLRMHIWLMQYIIHPLVLLLLDSLLRYTCTKDMVTEKCIHIKLLVMDIDAVISNLFSPLGLCSSCILHTYLDFYGSSFLV